MFFAASARASEQHQGESEVQTRSSVAWTSQHAETLSSQVLAITSRAFDGLLMGCSPLCGADDDNVAEDQQIQYVVSICEGGELDAPLFVALEAERRVNQFNGQDFANMA